MQDRPWQGKGCGRRSRANPPPTKNCNITLPQIIKNRLNSKIGSLGMFDTKASDLPPIVPDRHLIALLATLVF